MRMQTTQVQIAKPKLTVIIPSTILVNWEACNTCSYSLTWGENLSEFNNEMKEKTLEKNQLFEEFSDLKPGSEYKFCLQAKTECSKSDRICVNTTLANVPRSPQIVFSASKRSPCHILVAWRLTEPAKEFSVQVKSAQGTFNTNKECGSSPKKGSQPGEYSC